MDGNVVRPCSVEVPVRNKKNSAGVCFWKETTMAEDQKIVEVKVTNDGGEQVPVGIMNRASAGPPRGDGHFRFSSPSRSWRNRRVYRSG